MPGTYILTDFKYHNLRTRFMEDGIYYDVELDCHNAEEAATVITPGNLATWAPTTAYVMHYTRKPWNQDGSFEITAKDVDRVVPNVSFKGTMWRKTFYVLDGAPLTAFQILYDKGKDASAWTGHPSYMWDFSQKRLGMNWFCMLTAIDPNYHTELRAAHFGYGLPL